MRRIELTAELIERIALDVRAGNFMEPAARRHGVRHSTLHTWLARGRELLDELERREDRRRRRRDAPQDDVPKNWSERDRLCVDLVDALEKAEAEAEVRVVAIVQNAIPKSWQAGCRWLESHAPGRWLRVERTELTGAGGGPLNVEDPTEKLMIDGDKIRKRLLEGYRLPPSLDQGEAEAASPS